jgi:hypothetical protein
VSRDAESGVACMIKPECYGRLSTKPLRSFTSQVSRGAVIGPPERPFERSRGDQSGRVI